MDKISVQNFNAYYHSFQALKDINFTVHENEILSFIGPSGCGKSTMLKSVNRMNDFVDGFTIDGNIYLENIDIYDPNHDVNVLRRKIGMVFQNPNPFPMSIYDNITYGPKIHGIKNKIELAEIVESSLKKAAIWDEMKDNLHKNALSISGGQQQRLCIARAIAVNPDVILMDEPTSALDPISTAKIEELVEEIKSICSVVIVTHNMQQAARISDRTAFFLNGSIIELEKTKKLFSNPKNKKTEDYITVRFG